jgi:hypothetical protein
VAVTPAAVPLPPTPTPAPKAAAPAPAEKEKTDKKEKKAEKEKEKEERKKEKREKKKAAAAALAAETVGFVLRFPCISYMLTQHLARHRAKCCGRWRTDKNAQGAPRRSLGAQENPKERGEAAR